MAGGLVITHAGTLASPGSWHTWPVSAGQQGPDELRRSLGQRDAVAIGMGSMVGAGLFAVWGPATSAAGRWVLVALAVAAVVALCNALSSAALAARYPSAGGTYVYGRERLGPRWGYLAGWCFVIGKTASCAAMALTVGAYLVPEHARVVAVLAVLAVTGLNLLGVTRSARASEIVVAVVLTLVVALVVTAVLRLTGADGPLPGPTTATVDGGVLGVLEGAGLLFFAFAGYARIATLGEEVRDPARTIPRAVVIALLAVAATYAVVGVLLLQVLGVAGTAGTAAALSDVADRLWGSG
ncbi:MAG: APC family permease, partial [Actinobacteria bacterium]|nr:APC family permease [Actinomycetota bacterium]